MSYANKFGIERLIRLIKTGSKPATGPAAVAPPLKPPDAPAALPAFVISFNWPGVP